MIFTHLLIILETRKNPKFDGLKISNGQDMAILRVLKNENFPKIADLGTLRAFFQRCH